MLAAAATALAACNNDTPPVKEPQELSEEYYSGGELGTVFSETTFAYEQPTPAVVDGGFLSSFKRGETLFEKPFVATDEENSPRHGLGPLYLRTSCLHCHPGYGHGKRQTEYNSATVGNGYLLVITDKNDAYLSSLTGMPQTCAVAPFKAPVDETKIVIDWKAHMDEWNNTFPDGETYGLIYPEVIIPQDAYYVPLQSGGRDIAYEDVVVRLESTIGIYGTGLLDAITDADIKAEYAKQEQHGVSLNPAIWAGGDWVKQYANALQGDGTKYALRYTYALSRGPLQDGPGANAIWNITNVTRRDRNYHYMTAAYATKASQDPEVQARFYELFPQYDVTGNVETDIYNYLMLNTAEAKAVEKPEMADSEYADLMVWHRGLAVPAARNLDDPEVKRGKELFSQIGCATCHKPTWTTGDDNIADPARFFTDNRQLPRYPHQKIWPYTDMVQHRLFMKNDIRTGWCRTTPLWGRGLSRKCTGADDRLHDARARTVIEAIMWHGSENSDARKTVEKFRGLSKADRDAIVEFIEAI